MKFNIKTPLEFLKDFHSNAIVEIEGNLYKGTLTSRENKFILNVFGSIKVSFAQILKFTDEYLQISK